MKTLIVDYDLEGLDDAWESLVGAGIAIAQAADRNRWALGDVGARVERTYGYAAIRKFAAEIGVRPSTLYEYVAVAKFYPADSRNDFPALSWSHWRAAMKAHDQGDARDYLEEAEAMSTPADVLADVVRADQGLPVRPRQLLMTLAHCQVAGSSVIFTAEVEDPDTLELLRGGAFTLKVFPMSEEVRRD